jgi:prefoldin subunit 5
MTPERLKEIEEVLGDKVRMWGIGIGWWINAAEEMFDEIETLRARVEELESAISKHQNKILALTHGHSEDHELYRVLNAQPEAGKGEE